jgi:hypothetical protein
MKGGVEVSFELFSLLVGAQEMTSLRLDGFQTR